MWEQGGDAGEILAWIADMREVLITAGRDFEVGS